jgi:timeless
MDYKLAMTQHSSHIQSNRKKATEGGLLSVFVSLLAEPLSKTGTSRTNTDHLTIELVLHLFRNLLSAEPLFTTSTDVAQKSNQLHQELTALFESELVFDIIVVLAQEMESRENANYNLLIMEILNHLLKNQDPTIVAKAGKLQAVGSNSSTGKENPAVGSSGGLLQQTLMKEKSKFRGVTPSRHSHFGGTLVVQRADGKRQYVPAASMENGVASLPAGAKKRKNRKHEPFVGSSQKRGDDISPTYIKAQQTLHKFCARFVKDCYGPMMKSLKNEFRRDSVRLEEGDKVVFFHIVWFFNQWWRVSGKKQFSTGNTTVLGQMIFSMDLFMFNLVLNAVDDFVENKKYPQLAGAVALFSEQMHLLHEMYRSKDKTESSMSLGLMHQLFYKKMESIDRLPKLISKWAPGTSSREYLCDLVEVVHLSLKLLEANAVRCKESTNDRAIAKMQAAAAEFDPTSYVARKLITNNMIVMYTHLLSHYTDNTVHANHRVVAFLLRVCKIQIFIPDDVGDDTLKNPLATKTVTLEPMLYNIQMMIVLNTILNDMSIRKDKEYSPILSFATHVMTNISKSAKENPLLYVEALFRHPLPARFCEMTTNLYVNEELRMMAERELLMAEQSRTDDEEEEEEHDEEETAALTKGSSEPAETSPFVDSDEEDEVEWDGAGVEEGHMHKPAKKKRKKRIKKKQAVVESESSDDDDALDIEPPVEGNQEETSVLERQPEKGDAKDMGKETKTDCSPDSSEDEEFMDSENQQQKPRDMTAEVKDASAVKSPMDLDVDLKDTKKLDDSDDEDVIFDAEPGSTSRKNQRAMFGDDSDDE